MLLYHGTTVDFDVIDLGKSAPGKDFGRGFYLSDSRPQAEQMAAFKAFLYDASPIVLEFDFDDSKLLEAGLKVKWFKEYSQEWAEFVFDNRRNTLAQNLHDYDFVYGPIANDRVGAQIRELLENNIDFPTFLNRIKYGKGITFQYFFGTEKALALLRKL